MIKLNIKVLYLFCGFLDLVLVLRYTYTAILRFTEIHRFVTRTKLTKCLDKVLFRHGHNLSGKNMARHKTVFKNV